jgi:hypothetical protein
MAMDVQGSGGIAPFLTLALDGSELSDSCHSRFAPGERAPGTHWIRGWVVRRDSMDAVEYREVFCPCRESNPGCLPRSPSLYGLNYPGSYIIFYI